MSRFLTRRDRAESRLCQDLGHHRWGPMARWRRRHARNGTCGCSSASRVAGAARGPPALRPLRDLQGSLRPSSGPMPRWIVPLAATA